MDQSKRAADWKDQGKPRPPAQTLCDSGLSEIRDEELSLKRPGGIVKSDPIDISLLSDASPYKGVN